MSISKPGQKRCSGLCNSTCIISRTDASRNHGNASNERNFSSLLISNQKPCRDMLVTSAFKMFSPRYPYLNLVRLHKSLNPIQLSRTQPVIMSQFNYWFYPKLRFAVCGTDVNVHPFLFTWKEIKSKRTIAKYRRTHSNILTRPNKYFSPRLN